MYSVEKQAMVRVLIRTWSLLVCVLLFPGGCTRGEMVHCLVLSAGEPAKVTARLPLESSGRFSLESINSIYNAPVKETLAYEPSGDIYVVMVESPSEDVFRYYGLEPGPGGRALLHRKVGEVRLRSSDYANHRIAAGNRSLVLKGIVQDEEPVSLGVHSGRICSD